jgi:hypothetical protein
MRGRLLHLAAAALLALTAGCATQEPSGSTAKSVARQSMPFQEGPALPFQHETGGRSPLDILETAGAGCALLDYDNDGWLDLFLVGGGTRAAAGAPLVPQPSMLLRNDRRGGFTDVTGQTGLGAGVTYGMGCAAADYDGDGWIDLYVTGYGRNVLYRNRGGKRFEDVTERAGVRASGWSTSAAWGDVDGDGWLDLYVCRYLKFNAHSRRFCLFREVSMACPPSTYAGEPGILYRNTGEGTFANVTEASGAIARDGKSLGCIFTDLDDDGRLDLFVANDGVANQLFRNVGSWLLAPGSWPDERRPSKPGARSQEPRAAFTDIGLVSGTAYNANGDAEASMGVDAGDFDGDGRLDLVATSFQNETDAVSRNEGGRIFSYVTPEIGLSDATRPYLSFGCGWIDADNDADLDLFIVSGHVQDTIARADPDCAFAQPRHLFENIGDRFRAVDGGPPLTQPAVGRGAAFGDVDNDGDLDLLVSNNGGRPILLWNTAGSRRPWLRVRLQGRKPNRFGIGARVRLTAGGRTQIAEARAGHSYASTSDPRLHFGLGDATRVERLEIRWPRGARSLLENMPANQEVTVAEPN